jgi:ribosomal protein S18 acetylase RimI-like enzyme
MILQVEILAFHDISRTSMQIPYTKHLEAAATLTGGNKVDATVFLNRLKARSTGHTFYGKSKNAVVLVTEGNGSVATFMTSPPTRDNEEYLNLSLQQAKKDVVQKGIATAHAVLGEHDLHAVHLFENAGFTKLATLHFMEWVARTNQKNIAKTATATFCETSAFTPLVLQETMKNTYIGSLDCPAIHGKRNIKDIIKSHHGFDPSDVSLWFIILRNNETAGVLLLNQPENEQHLELAYLGITPKMRGIGLAKEAVDHAVNLAIKRRCKKIVLAVDSANTPAIRLYKKANFHKTANRIAMFCPMQ